MSSKLTKKNSCTRTCILSVLSLLSNHTSKRTNLIKRFIDEFKHITDPNVSTVTYLNFLKFLRGSKLIKCKVGLFYFEKYLLVSDYELIFFDLNLFYRNQFVNNKVIMFGWIEPKHLEISLNHEYITAVLASVSDINTLFTPTEKMCQLIEISKLIYSFHGKNLSQEKFLPIFIYTFLHFQIKNLVYNFNYIKGYFGIPMTRCKSDCTHLEGSDYEKCDCTANMTNLSIKEQEFYLTNFEAAICFIEIIDFNVIKANVKEYCDNIERLSESIDKSKMPNRIKKEVSFSEKARLGVLKIGDFVKEYLKKNFRK